MKALFNLRLVARPNDSYYFTNWDRAVPMSVVAETKQEAINQAAKLLGDPPQHRYWVARIVSVEPVPDKEAAKGD